MQPLLTQYHWLLLSNEERLLMRATFNIPRSGGTIMEDSKIKSDGCTHQDLQAVNVESMQKFLESKETDFNVLYSETIESIKKQIADKKEQEQEAALEQLREETMKHSISLTDSLLDTIKKLPIEAQQHLKEKLNIILGESVGLEEPIKKHVKTKQKGTE